jgi:DNA-binding NtrC family response regulator
VANTSESNQRAFRLILADDDPGIVASGRMLFEDAGWEIKSVSGVNAFLKEVRQSAYDVALVDMNYTRDTTSGKEGLELLDAVREIDSDLPVVVMTAWATVPLAVESLRRGARDVVTKPWDNERVVQLLAQVAQGTRAVRKSRLLEESLRVSGRDQLPRDFIVESASMQALMEVVTRISPSDANVLILGENGTGKSVLARMIHDLSHRSAAPFISVNVGGLSEGLFESELFGHVKGAFTDAKNDRAGRFELADGGTLFLDEIGNLKLPQQNRLLRMLETGEFERVGSSRTQRVDVRILSATNAVLSEQVEQRLFREDLYYRLNTVVIEMPPLRDRQEDILPIARRFCAELAQKYNKRFEGLDAEAERLLLSHAWPGNIREMRHAIERAVLMGNGPQLRAQHLMLSVQSSQGPVALEDMSMEEVEKILMTKALRKHQGNVTHAARHLGISRATFYRRMQEFGL